MSAKTIKVLLIEDNPDDADLIQELLSESVITQFNVHTADRLSSGLRCLTDDGPDIVLLDLGLPDSQGLETLDRVRAASPEVAVIVLTGLDDEVIGPEVVQRGAQDYLVKGRVDGNLLRRSIRYALHCKKIEDELRQHRDRLGELVEERTVALRAANKRLQDEIVERGRAEEALRQSEQNLARAQHIAHLGSWDWDIAGNTLTWSDELYRIFGVSKETFELTYDNIANMIHADDRDRNDAKVQELLTTADQLDYEFRIIRPDGSIRHILQMAQVTRDAVGKAQRAFGTMMDITERKRGEGALRESEERHRLVLENSLDAILLTVPDGRILAANPAACRMFDRTEEEIRQVGRAGVVDGSDPRLAAALEERTRTGRFSGELTLLRKDGSPFPGEVSTAVFTDRNGEARTSMIIRDITERREAEEALRESEQRFRLMVEGSIDGIVMTDTKGNISEWNQGMEQITGLQCKEVVGQPLWEVQIRSSAGEGLTPQEEAHVRDTVRAFLETGRAPWLGDLQEVDIRHTDGSVRSVQQRAFSVKSEEGYMLCSIVRDITEHKRVEQALRSSEAQYRRLVEGSPDIVWTFSDKRGTLYVSSRVEAILGYSQDHLYVNPWLWNKSIHPDDQGRIAQAIADFATGTELNVEYRIKDASGNWRWFNDRSIGKCMEGDETIIEGISTDVTDHKLAEAALQRAETHLRAVLSSAPITIFAIDNRGRFTLSDGRGLARTGLKPGENVGASALDLYGDLPFREYDGKVTTGKDILQRAFAGETVNAIDELHGVYFDNHIGPLRDTEGKIVGIVGVATDITERKQAEEQLKQRNQELAALLSSSQQLARETDLEELLKSIAHSIVDMLPSAEAASLWLYDERRNVLSVRAWAGHDDEAISGLAVSPNTSIVGLVYRTGQPQIVRDASNEAAFEALGCPALDAVRSVVGVPLLLDNWPIGCLFADNFSHPQAFGEAEERLLLSLAGRASVAIQNARLIEEIRVGHEQLRALTAQLAEAEEFERRRLARELHDQVGQNLTALGINLNIALSQVQGEREEVVRSRLQDSLKLAEETTERIRNVMADLRPPMLDDYGLAPALRWYGEQFAARTGIAASVQGDEPEPRLPARVENTLFRITQEALTNVAKHAQATQVTMTIEPQIDIVRLVITDDGVGFEPKKAVDLERPVGWGLTTMTERAEAAGGRCQIKSHPGSGTQVIVEVPR